MGDLGADNGVAKSNGGDVGGTWLQLMCCALPKCLCPQFVSEGWNGRCRRWSELGQRCCTRVGQRGTKVGL